jgi:SAM-dependent methyltransferase
VSAPIWTGTEFRVGDSTARILSYELGTSGWTDGLTELHESAEDENHYINVASREHAVSRLERWVFGENPVLIDIGCSSGYTVRLLRKRMPHAVVFGADYVRRPLEKLGHSIPDLPLLQFDLVNCPLPEKSFDGVILLNVLEHIDDDDAALRQAVRILKPGGVAAIEVPAGPNLYDIYDKQLMHFRRYRMADLIRKVRASGLEILERSHLGCFLYPAFWIVKKRNRRHLQSKPEEQRIIVSGNMQQAKNSVLLNTVLSIEAWSRRHVYLPVGIRCLITGRKTS